MSRYFATTRSAYYAVVASLPLLVIYEALLTFSDSPMESQVRNAADVWLRTILVSLGVSPFHSTLVMILALVLAIPLLRPRSAPLNGRYLGTMFLESILYGFFLGIVINYILYFFFTLAVPMVNQINTPLLAMPANIGFSQGLALSLGAGLFEEFFFRVILLSAVLYLARLMLAEWLAVTVAIIGAAFLFSLAHYIGPLGEPLEIHSFLFRWVAGLLFTILYFLRGFAVTAYAHAFYDIFVITGLFRIVGW